MQRVFRGELTYAGAVHREPLDLDEYDRIARSDCFVCRLVAGRPLLDGHRMLYEDDETIAFLSAIQTQRGYSLVCPKRHAERFETDLDAREWAHVQEVVHAVAAAVSSATGAMRMYVAALGSPERNPHVHVHVCPCPAGTPFEAQQLAAISPPDGTRLVLSDAERDELAEAIREALGGGWHHWSDGGAETEALRPFVGKWIAQRGREVLVAADSPDDVVRWLSTHRLQADVMFRVPASDDEAGGGGPSA